jgi:hypothetical protein
MVAPNTSVDSELPSPTRREARGGTSVAPWWKRAASYGVRRLADSVGGSGRQNTSAGEGRSLLRERRAVRLRAI